MLEARVFIKSVDFARDILTEQKAIFKGEYALRDSIFAPTDPNKTLLDSFLRLRVISKNIWDEKNVIVSIKNTELKKLGKDSKIPLRKEFDREDEAVKFIEENLSGEFQYSFEFDRIGWQYNLGEDQVDLEEVVSDIENRFSIEVKSPTEAGLERLLQMFSMEDPIKGPSVVAVKELLGK